MESETDQVIKNLRACLLSVKGDIPITSLDRDYKVLIGHSIPYRKLGFDSLEYFLRSIPNVSISKKNGETYLDATPSESTAHLASLISRQRSAPKKARPTSRVGLRRTAAMQWRPPPTVVRSAPKTVRRPSHSPRSHISVTLSQTRTSRTTRQVAVNNLPASKDYETPPRFQRPGPQSKELCVSNGSTVQPLLSRPIPRLLPRTIKIPPLLGEAPLASPPGDVIQSLDELEAQVKQLALNSSHASSASALQARLKKLPQTQVPSVLTLGNHVVADLSRNSIVDHDHQQELQNLTVSLGLGKPTFKVVPRFPKGESIMFSCIVKVGEESYNSFPDESPVPALAVQLAAKRALSELQKRGYSHSFPITQDNEVVKIRVSELVASHPAGIWNSQIPVDYCHMYQEALPSNWLQIVRDCPTISMEQIGNNRVILSQNIVSSSDIESNISSVSWPQVQIPVVPDPITLPSGEVWDVFVTYALTTVDVWVRLIGDEYSVRYEAMSTDMEIHYMEKAIQASNPQVGQYYAIQEDSCWQRVQLLEVNDDSGVVYFLDHGDEGNHELKKLHVLEPAFCKLPAQAVQLVLCGLEEFSDDPNATNHLVDTVIGKTLVAQVISRSSPDDPDTRICVQLYDTNTDEDINVNRLLTERISQDARAPRLPENGVVNEVFLSHVNEKGELFLNVKSESFSYLQSLMEKLMEGGISETNVAKASNHSTDPSKLYLARYSVDFEYYRALVISEPDEKNWVTVQFVDYGNTENVAASSLLLLGLLSESLERFPYQAIRVVLHNVPPEAFGPRFVERIRELVKDNEPILVKVMKSGADKKPHEVEMFKRTEDKQFISINNTLALDPELVKPKPTAESRLRRRHGQRSHPFDLGQGDNPRGLGVPQIPDVGQYFDVHVTMAANPSNFTVQPYKERVHLEELMCKMQDYYSNHTSGAVSPESVKEGSLFAAHHNDSQWYRVTVSNVISGSTVSVYFCDFGDVAFLPLDRLQPLSNQFRTLPSQAIKAKLARIMPSHGDWSVEDCIRFQERVVEKQFVSVIVDSGPDLLNPSDIVIGLQLYDTSGAVDIEIDKLLVEEKRAVFTPTVLQQLQQVQQIG